MKKSIFRAITIVVILSCIIGFIGYQKAKAEKVRISENQNFYAVAVCVYLGGKAYFHNGEIAYELPEDFAYAGRVINVGNTFSGKDFEGNAEGMIYMNPFVSDTVYFSWAQWNEETDGTAPFLKLEYQEND